MVRLPVAEKQNDYAISFIKVNSPTERCPQLDMIKDTFLQLFDVMTL
jgi:hypothetical protein